MVFDYNKLPTGPNTSSIVRKILRHHRLRRVFSIRSPDNSFLDIFTKRAAIKASSSIVSLVTYSGDKEINHGSGTIIENDGVVLTSANLIRCPSNKNDVASNIKVKVHLRDGGSYEAQILAHDFYFNIAFAKIQCHSQLPVASLRLVDDYLSVDLNDGNPIQPPPHSDLFNLIPGQKLTALGRYFEEPYDLMAASGEFSTICCHDDFDCKELFTTTCLITKAGEGGPLVNHYGEVIGMIFESFLTPFLPINIVFKWWEHYKKYKVRPPRPLLGMELTNFYAAADLELIEEAVLKLPTNFAGVVVEAVIPGSSAHSAGICSLDTIVECCGNTVRSCLQLHDMLWDKIGNSVELVVIRRRLDSPLLLNMVVEGTEDEYISSRLAK